MIESLVSVALKTDAPVTVRPAAPSDLDFVCDIECRSFSGPWSRETLREEMVDNGRSHMWVAESGERITGFMIYWTVADEIHLLNLAVHPDWRRRGVAAAMLHRLMAVARDGGFGEVLLEVRVSNKAAQVLYRKFGFAPLGIRPRYYTDNGEDAVVMCYRRNG
jgi:ribosomal-protein-alanine N-acetyltransferase